MNKNNIIFLEALIDNRGIREGAIEYIEYLIRNNIFFVIVSEQCSRNKSQIIEYLTKYGFPMIEETNIFTSSNAAIRWLLSKEIYKNVAYLGGRGMKEAIETSPLEINYTNPDAVLIGLNREVSYKDYNDFLQYILNKAQFISVDDRKSQLYEGLSMIGNAAIVKMLETASNTKALKFGRGNEMLLIEVMKNYDLDKEDTILISDEFYLDILPAMNLGLETTLITNGNSLEKYGFDNNFHPTHIAENYKGLLD